MKIEAPFTVADTGLELRMACIEDIARLDVNFEDYISDNTKFDKIFDVRV